LKYAGLKKLASSSLEADESQKQTVFPSSFTISSLSTLTKDHAEVHVHQETKHLEMTSTPELSSVVLQKAEKHSSTSTF
jgi:hypothetical protein